MIVDCPPVDALLFDYWDCLGERKRRLLDHGWSGVFRHCLFPVIPLDELKSTFNKDFGRPTKNLSVVVGALILQQLHDLTDQETVEAIAFNIAWHYALDIQNPYHAYLCERTLRNYRRKIVELGLDKTLFADLTDELIEKFGVNTSLQRIDSTAIKSAMKIMTRLGILVASIRKFLREVKHKPHLWFSHLRRNMQMSTLQLRVSRVALIQLRLAKGKSFCPR